MLKRGMSRMGGTAAGGNLILRMVKSPWVVGGLIEGGVEAREAGSQ